MNRSKRIMLFAGVLGWYFTLICLRAMAPTGFVFLITPMLAVFWPILGRKQKLIFSGVRLAVMTPMILRLSMKMVPLIHAVFFAVLWYFLPDDTTMVNFDKALMAFSGVVFASSIVINVICVIIVLFPISYLLSRVYRRMGVYDRFPRSAIHFLKD